MEEDAFCSEGCTCQSSRSLFLGSLLWQDVAMATFRAMTVTALAIPLRFQLRIDRYLTWLLSILAGSIAAEVCYWMTCACKLRQQAAALRSWVSVFMRRACTGVYLPGMPAIDCSSWNAVERW
eukprot:3957230-Amphidinium_carterae.1